MSLPRRLATTARTVVLWAVGSLLAAALFPLPPISVNVTLADLFPLVAERALISPQVQFSERVLARLESAENLEIDPWLRDDLRIAWITVRYAQQSWPQPFVAACYAVIGLHPDRIWDAIQQKRRAHLGAEYDVWFDQDGVLRSAAHPPKKPATSVRDSPRDREDGEARGQRASAA